MPASALALASPQQRGAWERLYERGGGSPADLAVLRVLAVLVAAWERLHESGGSLHDLGGLCVHAALVGVLPAGAHPGHCRKRYLAGQCRSGQKACPPFDIAPFLGMLETSSSAAGGSGKCLPAQHWLMKGFLLQRGGRQEGNGTPLTPMLLAALQVRHAPAGIRHRIRMQHNRRASYLSRLSPKGAISRSSFMCLRTYATELC